jgi:hypothetical protein
MELLEALIIGTNALLVANIAVMLIANEGG